LTLAFTDELYQYQIGFEFDLMDLACPKELKVAPKVHSTNHRLFAKTV
jgi:hypothetical protein